MTGFGFLSAFLSPHRLKGAHAILYNDCHCRCSIALKPVTQTPLSPSNLESTPLSQLSADALALSARPDPLGRFGQFGGKYVPETLMPALAELEEAYYRYRDTEDFKAELDGLLRDYVGRATPLYFAERLTAHYVRPDGSGPQIYLKREDLNHTGAHKINNALGQVLLAKRMGKELSLIHI